LYTEYEIYGVDAQDPQTLRYIMDVERVLSTTGNNFIREMPSSYQSVLT
jgi:hypothetical protein